jgi:hypothetical protein
MSHLHSALHISLVRCIPGLNSYTLQIKYSLLYPQLYFTCKYSQHIIWLACVQLARAEYAHVKKCYARGKTCLWSVTRPGGVEVCRNVVAIGLYTDRPIGPKSSTVVDRLRKYRTAPSSRSHAPVSTHYVNKRLIGQFRSLWSARMGFNAYVKTWCQIQCVQNTQWHFGAFLLKGFKKNFHWRNISTHHHSVLFRNLKIKTFFLPGVNFYRHHEQKGPSVDM